MGNRNSPHFDRELAEKLVKRHAVNDRKFCNVGIKDVPSNIPDLPGRREETRDTTPIDILKCLLGRIWSSLRED
jgi:hypothetical protein